LVRDVRAEERAVRKAAGIAGVGDMAALLQAAPRELVEVLRINTVIRSITGQLVRGWELRRGVDV
jgi:phage antirepressor YoqD-like protein